MSRTLSSIVYWLLGSTLHSRSLPSSLPQTVTNGASVLGTLKAPQLPQFLANSPLVGGFPWGYDTTTNTNPYTDSPHTGVIRSYTFNVTRSTLAPDGFSKSVILVNDQFPGPTIEANWGDTFQITVNNNIVDPVEGTSLHWHGILQKETVWEDGTPGVHTCPIAPGKSFTYNFRADLYGTSWWHSHFSAQYGDGLFGAMVVHGPHETTGYDIDLGPIILSDWYHSSYLSILETVLKSYPVGQRAPSPQSANTLINGKNNFNCSTVTDGTPCTNNAGIAKFAFKTGQRHLLRLINAGSDGIMRFSIDDHTMEVIANDFVPIKPYNATVVTLAVGQRTDVVVRGTGSASGVYWMRSNISRTCSSVAPTNHGAVAAIYYDQADTNSMPNTTSWPIDDSKCANDDLKLTVPLFPINPSAPTTVETVTMANVQNATGSWVWTMNNSTFRADYNAPVLLLVNHGNLTSPPSSNVYNFGSNSSMRIVLENASPVSHPMHIHGHNMFVLADGNGTWDGTTLEREENPMRRDTHLLQPNGYFVLQVEADNPGVWPLHCHVATHISGGLYISILERPKEVEELNIPAVMGQTCRDWAVWTGDHIPDQIDSGL